MKSKKLRRLLSVALSLSMMLSWNMTGYAAEAQIHTDGENEYVTTMEETPDVSIGEAVKETAEVNESSDVNAIADVETHTHDYSIWVKNFQEATCTKAGVAQYQCSFPDCTSTTYKSIPAAHDYDIGRVTKEATCGEDGEILYTCKRPECTEATEGHTKTVVIPASGEHTFIQSEKPATCTEPKLVGQICSVCGTAGTDVQEEGEALGHDYQYETIEAPTCTETGKIKVTCSRCDYEAEEVAPPAHTPGAPEILPATCTENGKLVKKCTECNAILEVLDTDLGDAYKATGHTYDEGDIETIKEATCTENGTTKVACSVCGSVKYDILEKTGHDWDSGTVTTEATCTENGTKTYSCQNCGATKEEPVDVLGHDYVISYKSAEDDSVISDLSALTCGTEYKEVKGCSRCSFEEVTIKEIEHDWAYATVAATCTTDAKITRTCANENCDYHETPQVVSTEEGSALGHDFESDKDPKIDEATCVEDGTETRTCQREGCGETEETKIPALGHTWDEGEETPATCTENGKIVYTCTRTGCDSGENGGAATKETVIAMSGHTWDEGTKTPATCTDEGKTVYTCINEGCNVAEEGEEPKAATKTVTDPALGHNWDDGTVTKEATCTEAGEMTYTCTRKGCAETKTEEIPAVDHKWDEGKVTKEATCTEAGVKTYTCTREGCTATKTEEIEYEGHKDGEPEWVQENCKYKAGYVTKCTVCGAITKNECEEKENIDSLAHDYTNAKTEVITAPEGCTTPGVRAVYCIYCEEPKFETIPAEHTWGEDKMNDESSAVIHECDVCGEVEYLFIMDGYELCETCNKVVVPEDVPVKPATCTTAGSTAGTKCPDCDTYFTKPDVIEAFGHTEGNWIVKTPATCKEYGTEIQECPVCKQEFGNTRKTTELGAHNFDTEEVVSATCTENMKIYAKCSVCGEVDYDNVVYEFEGSTEGHSFIDLTAEQKEEYGVSDDSIQICEHCGKLSVTVTTGSAASSPNGSNIVTFTSSIEIGDGELVEFGVIYLNNQATILSTPDSDWEELLVLNSGNSYVKTSTGTNMDSTVVNARHSLNITVGDKTDAYIVARSYVVVKKGNVSKTYYGNIIKTNYNSLSSAN